METFISTNVSRFLGGKGNGPSGQCHTTDCTTIGHVIFSSFFHNFFMIFL
jgi:hypothetical protein